MHEEQQQNKDTKIYEQLHSELNYEYNTDEDYALTMLKKYGIHLK